MSFKLVFKAATSSCFASSSVCNDVARCSARSPMLSELRVNPIASKGGELLTGEDR